MRSNLLATWFHQNFWTTLYAQADTRERPVFMPYQSMSTAFRMSHAEWATRARLKAAWEEKSGVNDTHPCLRERIEALGQKPSAAGSARKERGRHPARPPGRTPGQ
ncbi:hypothetical protein LP419_14780 [Massilia sp. H-1]|nr:hypothetical protein LP419_14780 [Massilia sp. H-1]